MDSRWIGGVGIRSSLAEKIGVWCFFWGELSNFHDTEILEDPYDLQIFFSQVPGCFMKDRDSTVISTHGFFKGSNRLLKNHHQRWVEGQNFRTTNESAHTPISRTTTETRYLSKHFPTYPWNIPQTFNHLFMKEFLSFEGLGMPGVCSRGMLGFSWNLWRHSCLGGFITC